jgi:hypothetical protein
LVLGNQINFQEEQMAQATFEEALMRELRFGGLEKDNLKELVDIVAGINKGGLKKIKVFPRGIPVVDGVQVTGIVDSTELNKLLGEILLKTPRLGGVVVFPYGIPFPEIFRVNINVGPGPVSSNPMPGIAGA